MRCRVISFKIVLKSRIKTPNPLIQSIMKMPQINSVIKLKSTIAFAVIALLLILLQSCSKEKEYESTDSETESNKSHNAGQNCMACHKPGGGEAPTWNLAGTVYNQARTAANSNATVKLYTGPDGTGVLKYTFKVDALGNFYTGGAIDFTGDLYPSVTGATTTQFMSSPITSGACNSCHNTITTGRIWAN